MVRFVGHSLLLSPVLGCPMPLGHTVSTWPCSGLATLAPGVYCWNVTQQPSWLIRREVMFSFSPCHVRFRLHRSAGIFVKTALLRVLGESSSPLPHRPSPMFPFPCMAQPLLAIFLQKFPACMKKNLHATQMGR